MSGTETFDRHSVARLVQPPGSISSWKDIACLTNKDETPGVMSLALNLAHQREAILRLAKEHGAYHVRVFGSGRNPVRQRPRLARLPGVWTQPARSHRAPTRPGRLARHPHRRGDREGPPPARSPAYPGRSHTLMKRSQVAQQEPSPPHSTTPRSAHTRQYSVPQTPDAAPVSSTPA